MNIRQIENFKLNKINFCKFHESWQIKNIRTQRNNNNNIYL